MALLATGCNPIDPISYTTSCGQGEFSFEPYQSQNPSGLSTPIFPTDPDAHCVSPGSTLEAAPLTENYGQIASIDRVQLMIYHRGWVNDPNFPSGGFWNVLADPDFIEITDFNLNPDGNLEATIPTSITGVPPTSADIRMTYTDSNGVSHVVELENERDGSAEHKLFFVPRYKVYLGSKRIDIGFNVLDHTVTGSTFPGFGTVYTNGWEPYCRIRYIDINDSGFPGDAKFWDIPAMFTNPNQGYRVEMPSGRTGNFHVQYQVVCPDAIEPSGRNLFTSWGPLGNYSGSLSKGWPAISEIEYNPPWF